MQIIEVAVNTHLRKLLDYRVADSELQVQIGQRVKVPLNRRQAIGVIMGIKKNSTLPSHQIKKVIEILDAEPILSSELIELLTWLSDYYHHPLGEVLALALPGQLKQGGKIKFHDKIFAAPQINKNSLSLNSAQTQAINEIIQTSNFKCFLLQGVTGSGKTEVYLRTIDHLLAQQKSALILVPEIALTPQTIKRFEQRYGNAIGIMHSALTPKQKNQTWLAAKNGEIQIVIGTRSAIFMPMTNLGIIIIDEEHDTSYKQQTGVRYSARDVAVRRAQLANIPIILGSATPSLESMANAVSKKYQLLILPARATGAKLPHMQLIDLKREKMLDGLTPTLIETIKNHLARDEQILLFLNRRGFSTTLLCQLCGKTLMCPRCDAKLIYHRVENKLRCHHCDHQRNLTKKCTDCNTESLIELGAGTEKIETALQKLFPDIELIRIDRDRVRNNKQLHTSLDKIVRGKKQILLGTQMLTKGHHFPQVSLVGIIDGDSGLYSTDFRASERMTQMIIQVAGRAGRAEIPGKVLIQTHQTAHPLWQSLLNHDYNNLTNSLLQERQQAKFPPFCAMALIRAESSKLENAMKFLQQCKHHLIKPQIKKGELFGPFPTPMEKKQGKYRAQLLLQTTTKSTLQKWLKTFISVTNNHKLQSARWYIDVDPLELN